MRHQGSEGWREEIEKTRRVPHWKDELLSRAGALLGEWGRDVRRIGYKINETQIQHEFPISSLFSFKPLHVLFVQFNTWEPITKKPGTRVVRFGPNTACLMVLVKNPLESGEGYEWLLLARRKYQFAAGQQHFTEFSRGFTPGKMDSDQGCHLFDRDFPGFRVNGQGADFVENVFHTQLGRGVFENTGEYNNKASKHLIVVTLKRHLSKDELKAVLVAGRLEAEYRDNPDYPDLSELDGRDLVSEPMVFELTEAAKLLNAHLEGDKEACETQFGEVYSLSCWEHFLTLYGHQFPDITPKECTLPV